MQEKAHFCALFLYLKWFEEALLRLKLFEVV